MADSRRALRDQLMHSDGTTPFETMLLILPTLFFNVITTIIITTFQIQTKNVNVQFFIEFLTLVIPIILNITVLSDYAIEVFITSFIICLSMMWYSRSNKTQEANTKPPEIRDHITNTRSTVNIISVVAILAVDFLIFPRRLAKTETFGHSLMDVGVGLFVFSNGIVDGGQTNFFQAIKGSIPLLVLGFGRFLATKQIDYHVPVSEYGVHWNFFLTLAVTKIFVSLIFSTINVKFVWINAVLLMISHEILLEMGLKNFVMSKSKREGFIAANKEGLASSMGYVYTYLLSAYFSYFMGLKRGCDTPQKTITKFVYASLLTLILSTVFEHYFGISRRLANAAYCFWILFIGIFVTGLYYIFGRILELIYKNKMTGSIQPPLIFRAINYNGLAFFLVSNVLTGLVNISCNTLAVGPIASLTILSIYMLINCGLVVFLYTMKIKLKL